MDKAIGGYFELEINSGTELYSNLKKFNTARNALKYILIAHNVKVLYLPKFTCEALYESFIGLDIEIKRYEVDKNLEICFNDLHFDKYTYLLYTNYFGIKDKYIDSLIDFIPNLIIDNAQALFSKPMKNIPTVYSPRKFVGVCDGGYLSGSRRVHLDLKLDVSNDRMSHLLIRTEIDAEMGYSEFIQNETTLEYQPIKKMSILTQRLLASLDYEFIKKRRKVNFEFLHSKLGKKNILKIDNINGLVPISYPFWTEDDGLRQRLKENRIYTPTYWPNCLLENSENSITYKLSNEIVHLPIDQRYDLDEMKKIIKTI